MVIESVWRIREQFKVFGQSSPSRTPPSIPSFSPLPQPPHLILPQPFSTPYTKTMPFAQLIIGPPGSGKSTYADGMHQFLSALGRKCSVVNLDPANDHTNYPCALDIRDLVRLEDVMEEEGFGPNGGVLFALEEVEQEGGWLEGGLRGLEGGWV